MDAYYESRNCQTRRMSRALPYSSAKSRQVLVATPLVQGILSLMSTLTRRSDLHLWKCYFFKNPATAWPLDGIVCEGVPVRVRRPSDYKPSMATTLGPSQPSRMGLTPRSALLNMIMTILVISLVFGGHLVVLTGQISFLWGFAILRQRGADDGYPVVSWVSFKICEQLGPSIAAGPQSQQTAESSSAATVRRRLSSFLRHQKLLLVLDDVPEEEFLREMRDFSGVGVRCFVTSRRGDLCQGLQEVAKKIVL